MSLPGYLIQSCPADLPDGQVWNDDGTAPSASEAVLMADAYGYVQRNNYRIVAAADHRGSVVASRASGEGQWIFA